MTPIEIIALILAMSIVIKTLVFLVNPKSWMKVPKMMFAQPMVAMIMSLVLAAIVLYYLLAELTIVQIFAVMAFLALIMMSSLSAYSKEFVGMANKMIKDKNILKKSWLPTTVWVVLTIWALYALFA